MSKYLIITDEPYRLSWLRYRKSDGSLAYIVKERADRGPFYYWFAYKEPEKIRDIIRFFENMMVS